MPNDVDLARDLSSYFLKKVFLLFKATVLLASMGNNVQLIFLTTGHS